MIGLLTATVQSPKLTARLGATQISDGAGDTTPVSLHRLLTAVWTQNTDSTEIGDSGVEDTRGHYTSGIQTIFSIFKVFVFLPVVFFLDWFVHVE